MTKRWPAVLLLALFGVIVGCGGTDDGSPTDGAPPAPEAGSADYDSYSNAGRQGPPGSGHGAN
ncbi:MAG: hypothetical protein KDA91_06580 [Planctomycetaceae bacterium]|nr:hypothetical protein [Planctomycetaceae bacterium]